MKNSVSITEERQFITRGFADTLGGNTPWPTPAPLGSFTNPIWVAAIDRDMTLPPIQPNDNAVAALLGYV
jgi:hypothetical protein